MEPPLDNVSVPPTVAPEMLNAEASMSDALPTAFVDRLAIPNTLPALVSEISPLAAVTLNAFAWIAPVCPMEPADVNVSVPPTMAPVMFRAEAS